MRTLASRDSKARAKEDPIGRAEDATPTPVLRPPDLCQRKPGPGSGPAGRAEDATLNVGIDR